MAKRLMGQAIYRAMARLVNSAEGIKRAVRATNDGQPALAGVDALLRQELGSEYECIKEGAWWAGFTVAEMMREMGFVEAGTGKCPPGCIASQGTVWKPKAMAVTPVSAHHDLTGLPTGDQPVLVPNGTAALAGVPYSPDCGSIA